MSDFLKALESGASEARIYDDNKATFDEILNELEQSFKTFFNLDTIELNQTFEYENSKNKNIIPASLAASQLLTSKYLLGYGQEKITKKTGFINLSIQDIGHSQKEVTFCRYSLSSKVFPVTIKTNESNVIGNTAEDVKNIISELLSDGKVIRKINNMIK
jgi:hypothetical protein